MHSTRGCDPVKFCLADLAAFAVMLLLYVVALAVWRMAMGRKVE